MSHTPDDDRDAHLLAALRHAPDRDVQPPADVSAAILVRAQAAVQPARTRSPNGRAGWRAAIDQVLRPGPMAAFGTVALATLIGVMWSGQSPPDATPSLRAEAGAAAPAAAPASADTVPAAQAPSAQREAAPTAAQTSPPVVRPPPRAVAEALQKRAAPEVLAAAESKATQPQPQPMAAAAQIAAAPQQDAQREPAAQDAAAKSTADAAPATLALPARRSRAESTAATLGAAAPDAAAPLTAPTIELEAAVRSDPARVRWQVAGGRMAAHGPAQRDWWAALARATQGRWHAAGGGEPAGMQVTLTIDGVPRGSLAFEPNHLLWREPGGLTWRAPIAADTLREWQAALARW